MQVAFPFPNRDQPDFDNFDACYTWPKKCYPSSPQSEQWKKKSGFPLHYLKVNMDAAGDEHHNFMNRLNRIQSTHSRPSTCQTTLRERSASFTTPSVLHHKSWDPSHFEESFFGGGLPCLLSCLIHEVHLRTLTSQWKNNPREDVSPIKKWCFYVFFPLSSSFFPAFVYR